MGKMLDWLHQLFVDSLFGRTQAATENGQQVKPDIGVGAEYTSHYDAEFAERQQEHGYIIYRRYRSRPGQIIQERSFADYIPCPCCPQYFFSSIRAIRSADAHRPFGENKQP